jgi:probable F420-dependent oxidoreductase
VKFDSGLEMLALTDVPAAAQRLEALGYAGAFTFEGPHDPFLPLMLAAEHTTRLELMTAVAIAFARNPMTVAQISYDLQLASKGRMIIGLGTQIPAHITKRFSMPWSQPAARMREFVLAMRAIWARWHEGTPLDFRGEFYRHTLMTPMFDPGPSPWGPPVLTLAGIGPRMTEVAGEVADGFMVHPLTTPQFLQLHTLPALERGFAARGGRPTSFELQLPAMVAIGDTDEQIETARNGHRHRLAFYGSTPAYRVVLDAHGLGEMQPELNRLSKLGEWQQMTALVTDDIVDLFVTSGRPEEIPGALEHRYGAFVDRIAVHPPAGVADDRWAQIIRPA